MPSGRRTFLKTLGAAGSLQAQSAAPQSPQDATPAPATAPRPMAWPRRFTGPQLAQIAMPLGGIAAGSVSLGGRGQLRDWEIFNRPDKGNNPQYAFASIWVQRPGKKPVARIAESKMLPPFEGQNGLGSANAPGLPRLDSATFHGSYPTARIDFTDRALPVKLSLDAFTPIIPLDADASGLPAALLRYTATNRGAEPVEVAVAYSLENFVGGGDKRLAEVRESPSLKGLVFTNPALESNHALQGDISLTAIAGGEVTVWRGWPKGGWWNSPMLFWDEFSSKGRLGAEPDPRGPVGTVCIRKTIAPGASAEFAFILAWRFPNRTPARCSWKAPEGQGETVIGNWYCTKFADSFAAAEHLAANLPDLEKRTRAFVAAMRESTLPAPVKDAAMSNLSTLATQTFFRTADGRFHGFEGSNDKSGCCFGSCTHVWNYETTTAHLFPEISRSMRATAFHNMLDEQGGMRFRLLLPYGKEKWTFTAADGQMGQVMKAYLDWRLCGDTEWLRSIWPDVKKSMEYCWLPGGWDADRDGVMEGVQHNTYDVEFYGPNPQCGVYYLGALRAAAEMAQALGEESFANSCRDLFRKGSAWIDANLFNSRYYVQKVQGLQKDKVLPSTMGDMGSADTQNPEYQVGGGCLVDQLVGQYQADVCGLGPLLKEENLRKALESIWRYNHKPDLSTHESVQRIFAVNDESGMVICDYGEAPRPKIPFPYYAELMTGFEYAAAAQMMWSGMVREGIAGVEDIRNRHDGLKRNPFNEPECGHHYARAMAAWSPVLALSGFHFDAPAQSIRVTPRWRAAGPFRSFWSTGSGWGTLTLDAKGLSVQVVAGSLRVKRAEFGAAGKPPRTKQLTDAVLIREGDSFSFA